MSSKFIFACFLSLLFTNAHGSHLSKELLLEIEDDTDNCGARSCAEASCNISQVCRRVFSWQCQVTYVCAKLPSNKMNCETGSYHGDLGAVSDGLDKTLSCSYAGMKFSAVVDIEKNCQNGLPKVTLMSSNKKYDVADASVDLVRGRSGYRLNFTFDLSHDRTSIYCYGL